METVSSSDVRRHNKTKRHKNQRHPTNCSRTPTPTHCCTQQYLNSLLMCLCILLDVHNSSVHRVPPPRGSRYAPPSDAEHCKLILIPVVTLRVLLLLCTGSCHEYLSTAVCCWYLVCRSNKSFLLQQQQQYFVPRG